MVAVGLAARREFIVDETENAGTHGIVLGQVDRKSFGLHTGPDDDGAVGEPAAMGQPSYHVAEIETGDAQQRGTG